MKIILFILLISLSFAGGWTKKKGGGFFQIGTRYLKANQSYNAAGEKVDIATIRNYFTSVYGEFGLTDNITLIGKIPFSSLIMNNRETENGIQYGTGAKNSSIGDLSLGFRYGLQQEGWLVFALSSEVEFATGDDTNKSGLITGDGELNVKFGIELGASFGANGYFVGSIGQNFRFEGFSNEFMLNLEYGVKISENLLTSVKLRNVTPSKDLTSGGFNQAFQQSEYTSYAFEASYFIKKDLGVSVAFESAFNVKNNFAAPVLSIGMFLTI